MEESSYQTSWGTERPAVPVVVGPPRLPARLRLLIALGMLLPLASWLLVLLRGWCQAPSWGTFLAPTGPWRDVAVSGVAALSAIWVLMRIRQRRNWARRLFILTWVLTWPAVPVVLVVARHLLGRSGWEIALEAFAALNLAVTSILALTLFVPSVRSFFCLAPPKGSHRMPLILVGILCLLTTAVGFRQAEPLWQAVETLMVRLSSGPPSPPLRAGPQPLERRWASWFSAGHRRQMASDAVERRARAEAVMGLRLPAWGQVDEVLETPEASAVVLVEPSTRHVVLLLRSRAGRPWSAVQLLEALGDPRRWVILAPNVSERTRLVVGAKVLDAATASLFTPGIVLDGMTVRLPLTDGTTVVVLSYGDPFDPARLERFLGELLQGNPA